MALKNIHEITKDFELELAKYTGAPYVCCTDNMSNALWLCLMYLDVKGKPVHIPSHTYPSVPAEIILANGKVNFYPSNRMLKGAYQLAPFPIWDSALRFTADMYEASQFQCVSFTGQYKHLKLGKGGAILFDDPNAVEYFKRMRNSGRGECSYHEDTFTLVGRNCYMPHTIAALGLQLLPQFYNLDGTKKENEDVCLPYPDLSKHSAFKQ